VLLSSTNDASYTNTQWGLPGDTPVVADFDGDAKADLAVVRPETGTWWVLLSSTGSYISTQWGLPGDVPIGGR
jgi:hypothetical protein